MKTGAKSDIAKNVSLIDENLLKSKIYTICGVKVMLDADLAEIYGYTAKTLNQQVKNNLEKFPDDFRFQLTRTEMDNVANMRSKILTSSWGGQRYAPFAFTEQGIYMLMTVLKGPLATAQSIAIIRLFKQMKDYIVSENQRFLESPVVAMLDSRITQNTKDIATVTSKVDSLSGEVHSISDRLVNVDAGLKKVMEYFYDPSTHKEFLIYDGQRLEADVAYRKIYRMAKKSVIIEDNYVDEKTLDLLQAVPDNATVTIISDEYGKSKLTESIKNDFKKTRPDVSFSVIRGNDRFHDRYIVLDYKLPSEKIFLCGSSSKDSGKRIMTITPVHDLKSHEMLFDDLFT